MNELKQEPIPPKPKEDDDATDDDTDDNDDDDDDNDKEDKALNKQVVIDVSVEEAGELENNFTKSLRV